VRQQREALAPEHALLLDAPAHRRVADGLRARDRRDRQPLRRVPDDANSGTDDRSARFGQPRERLRRRRDPRRLGRQRLDAPGAKLLDRGARRRLPQRIEQAALLGGLRERARGQREPGNAGAAGAQEPRAKEFGAKEFGVNGTRRHGQTFWTRTARDPALRAAGACQNPSPWPVKIASPSTTASHSSHSHRRSRGCRSQPQSSSAEDCRGGRASITTGASKLDVGADRLEARARAGLIGCAGRRARHADAGQGGAGSFDRQAAAERGHARDVADRAHRLARLRLGGQIGGGDAKRRRGPGLVGGHVDRVRAGEAIAQVDLQHAAAVAHGHADLVAALAAGLERGLRRLQRDLDGEALRGEGGLGHRGRRAQRHQRSQRDATESGESHDVLQRASSSISSGNISPISSCRSLASRPMTQTIGRPFGRPMAACQCGSNIAA